VRSASEPTEGLPSRAAQNIDLVIVQITNQDLKKSIEALIQMEAVVSDITVAQVIHFPIKKKGFRVCLI